jgi:hypothetical protein
MARKRDEGARVYESLGQLLCCWMSERQGVDETELIDLLLHRVRHPLVSLAKARDGSPCSALDPHNQPAVEFTSASIDTGLAILACACTHERQLTLCVHPA